MTIKTTREWANLSLNEIPTGNDHQNFEGWANAETYTFALYFGQERENHETMLSLARKSDGKININRACSLMRSTYMAEKMEPMDEGLDDPIYVREIVAHYENIVKEQRN